jgi:hypothetical protein
MKYTHPIFKFSWLLVGVIIVFGSCQLASYKPTTRTGTKGARVPFSSQSALTVDEIASALLTAESTTCLAEISVPHGDANQFEIYSTPGAGFPTDNGTYLVMSSGDATVVVPGTAASPFSTVNYNSNEGLRPVEDGGSPTGHETCDRASLRVKLSVPSDATRLSFDWKFGSEEPPNYSNPPQTGENGELYQDYFTAILQETSPAVVKTFVNDNIISGGANVPGGYSGIPTPPYPNPNNTIYNSTTPDIQTALIDVTSFQGMTITLDFHVADGGDPNIDSGVFLDNLGFDTSCQEDRFDYAAKIICGLQNEPNDMRLARGLYATAINIHNPNNHEVTFFKKLALTYPPKGQEPGAIMPIAFDTLKADEALKVDCMDIQRELFPNGFPTNYIKGFIVIQSPASLDVTGVYTTASLDEKGNVTKHSSIDVEQIRERKTKVSPPEMPKELDHFKVYQVDPIGANLDLEVRLNGQFDDQVKEAKLINITCFANPTGKTHPGGETGEIKDRNRHLNWYTLKQGQAEPQRKIRFHNQFGWHSVVIGDPRFLLVPAQKLSGDDSVFPDSLDHYKCYEVIEINSMPHLPVVILDDQFVSEEKVQVGMPKFFCVPVSKHLPGTTTEEQIMNPDDHLAIYAINPEPYQRKIKVKDQFGERMLAVTRSVMLAVPSKKQELN